MNEQCKLCVFSLNKALNIDDENFDICTHKEANKQPVSDTGFRNCKYFSSKNFRLKL